MRAPVSSHRPVALEAQSELAPAETPQATPELEEWETLFEQGAQPLTDRLLVLAGVEAGQRVLNMAAGMAEPALSAARLVGPSGEVVSFEPTTTKIPAESFDAAFSRWGLTSEDDLPGTLRRVSKLLKPGGHFAAAVWAASPKVPLLSLPGAVIAQSLRLPPRPGDPAFGLANRHALAHAFAQAGFVKVHSEVLTLTVSFAGTANYARYLQTASPYLVAMLATLPAEKQAQIWQAVGEAALRRYGGTDGLLRIPGETICVVGQKI